jgi:phosphate/sulfate permease
MRAPPLRSQGVGVASNWDWRSVSWRKMGAIFISWVLTLPVPALVSGLVMAFAIYAPKK